MKDSDKTKEQLIAEVKRVEGCLDSLAKQLNESEVKLRFLYDSHPFVNFIVDTDSNIVEVNRVVTETLGFLSAELVGKPFLDFVIPEHREKTSISLEQDFRGEDNPAIEVGMCGKDGAIRSILFSARQARLIDEVRVSRILITGIDITERKQAEEKIKHAVEEWRTTFDSITDLISINDRDFRFIRVNKAFADALKMKPAESIGKSCYEVVHGTKEPVPNCPHRKTIETKEPATTEFFEPNLGIHLEVAASPMLNEKGEVIASVHVVRDITERKRVENALRESEERYRTLVDTGGDAGQGILVVQTTEDQEATIVFSNTRLNKILDYSPEDLMGKPAWNFISPESLAMIQERYRKRQKGEDVTKTYEVMALRKDGTQVPVELSVGITTYDGKIATVAYVRDITERKQAEVERQELERKVQVTDRLASIGEMASGIAHEINNPLTGVVGFSELLMTKDLPEDLRKDVEIIHDGSQRVAGIVKRLLTFARQHKPERTCTDINEIIESTITLRKYSLETGNIEVSTLLNAELPWTMADVSQLQQVFMNIIVNAETEMKQAHGRGKLTIKTEQAANTIRISFTDDGPGIARENLEKVFNPFFTTREVGKGTGLGLSLSYGIIAEHKGALYTESEAGKGATFIIELPIVAEQEEKTERFEAVEEAGKVIGSRILVVDDEPTILAFLKRVLGGEGYDVETVSSGEEALGMIKNKRYGLILCDIKLPGLSGAEIYEQIEKVAPSLQKRVVFITGDVTSADTQAFLEKTKAPYVTKPFDIAKLKEEVNRILSGNR